VRRGLPLNFIDEAIIKLRIDADIRGLPTSIDLARGQVICDTLYSFEAMQLFDKVLEIVLPQEFAPMPEGLAAKKYLASQKPQVIFTSRDYTTDITLNLLREALKPDQVLACLRKLRSTIQGAYPATLFYDEETLDAVGISVAYMDYKSFSLNGPIYNIMFVSAICNRPLVGTFNCPFGFWEVWRPAAVEMLKTIRETTRRERFGRRGI